MSLLISCKYIMLDLNNLVDILGYKVKPIGSSNFLLSSYSLIKFRSIFYFLILNNNDKLSTRKNINMIA